MLLTKRLELRLHSATRWRTDLRAKLLQEGRLDWIDIGSSQAEAGFCCMNIVAPTEVPASAQGTYIQADISDRHAVMSVGRMFDLVRMQHVIEHFSPEEVHGVLDNVCLLLRPGGVLVLTVPDLGVHVKAYRQNYRFGRHYRRYARDRLGREPAAADTFSMFTHLLGYATPEVPGEAHKWCYDATSLGQLLTSCGKFSQVRRLGLLDRLSAVPFTHNRPTEDLCFIAIRQGNIGGIERNGNVG